MNQFTITATGALPTPSVTAGGLAPAAQATVRQRPGRDWPVKPHHFPLPPGRGPARGKRGASP